ncbi:hypothetical protein B0I32_15213 [Nonomuraea fuscirosea]|uniref:Uncharacterized protein n=1 Tax=Nonomuraea fuscirosea TaxID=1291556 RepID=A0A2T0LM04_9ACTN|nr:hypothetical protein [Nonomuraea fuscirosea]PRX44118.1 hypothetical protein B0I32_15213 [Nonomuraea fuscirosea]
MNIEPRSQEMAPERVLRGPVPIAPETVTWERVVQRICAWTVRGVDFRVTKMTSGGLQVCIDTPGSVAEQESWVLYHRMAREVALAGRHCEADADRLLVLGWSAACLHNRVRLLQNGLRRLTNFGPTARRAVRLAGRDPDGRPAEELVAAVCASIERRLRWPERLAQLAGYERSSRQLRVQLLLAQVAGLEAKVAAACEEHLVIAGILARAVCERYGRHGDFIHAQREVLTESPQWTHADPMIRGTATARPNLSDTGRSPRGLTERLIAASVINHGVPRATPQTVPPGGVHRPQREPADDALLNGTAIIRLPSQ